MLDRRTMNTRVLVGIALSSSLSLSLGCSSPGATDTATSAPQAVVSTGLVISGVYGGGGNTGATFANDFIELFNRGTTSVSTAGMSLQYASAAGDFGSPFVLPSVTIAPGRYFLVQGNSAGAVGSALPTPDAISTLNLSSINGKMALASVTTALACGGATRCNTTNVVDMVGYGTATDFEGPAGSAVGALTATTGAYRKGAGCTDTDVNNADFSIANPVTAPRNQGSAAAPCGGGTDAGVDADDGSTGTDSAIADTGSDTSTGTDSGPGNGTGLVISQVFGGGGSGGSAPGRDFVEIFNRGTVDVATTGLSLQVGASGADFGATAADVFALQDIVVPQGAYILVGLGPSADAGVALPAPDMDAPTLALDTANGKVALAKIATGLGCGGASRCNANVVDVVGYGTATDFEGSAATGALNGSASASRKGEGCTDTNDNRGDFTVGAPSPRNISTPRKRCAAPPPPDDGGVTPPADDAGTLPPIGKPDAGAKGGDAGGIGNNPVPDGGTTDTGGCNTSPARGGNAFAFSLAILSLAGLRRRRRHV